VAEPVEVAVGQGTRRVSLEAIQLAASVVCVFSILLAIASGATSFVLGRAIDRHRTREITSLLVDVRDRLLMNRARAPVTALPQGRSPPALGSSPVTAALPAPPAAAPAPTLAIAAPVLQTPAVPAPAAAATAASPSGSLPPLPLAPAGSGVRAITPDQRDRMVRILGLAPDSVVVTSDGSNEAEAFADQLAGVFRDAGWKVERSLFVSLKRPLPPLSADLMREPRDQAVIAAFAAGGYTLRRRDPDAAVQTREIFVGRTGAAG
jgi:hypothetical protein